jgi:hypothetical protein
MRSQEIIKKMNTQTDSILSLFEQNELNISRLYRLYSQKIPKQQAFWIKISKEEIQHALEIRKAYDGEDDIFEENNFSRGTIKYVADFVQSSIDQVKKEKLSHSEALEIALRVEQSFLEKKCFEIFIPNHQTVKKVLQKLNKETQEHIERLQIELERTMKKRK